MKLSNISASKATTYHKILVYGPPKSGKTRLVGRLASTNKLIYLDNEQSTTTLLSPDNLKPEFLSNIDLVQLRDTKDYPISAETFLHMTGSKPLHICDAHGKNNCAICAKDAAATFVDFEVPNLPPDTILVFDSLTQFTLSCINAITLGKPETYKMDFSDWGMLLNMVNKFCLFVQNVPAHVICVTHEEMLPMEDGKMRLVPAMGSSKFAPNTSRFFDHVVYLKLQGKDHKAGSSTGWDLQAITGSRSNLKLESVDASKVYSPLSELFKAPVTAK